MQLVGMLDSPYVRRVAISLYCLDIPFEHKSLSVFRNFEEFARINPLVKAPTLISNGGKTLMDSTLILEYLEALSEKSLMPADLAARQHALQLIGLALMACDKTVQIVYERTLRPIEKQHQPWIDRVTQQVTAAYDLLEAATPSLPNSLMQSEISVAVAWRFTQQYAPDVIAAADYPTLAAFSQAAEQRPEFTACSPS
ncbi:MAG: glutathione S-transferase [Leptolyngbya sp. SIO4C1]|nr:glutathione S-transferase [Leptolyngbya sp. SIO4C1]